jgi:hypothetical protein
MAQLRFVFLFLILSLTVAVDCSQSDQISQSHPNSKRAEQVAREILKKLDIRSNGPCSVGVVRWPGRPPRLIVVFDWTTVNFDSTDLSFESLHNDITGASRVSRVGTQSSPPPLRPLATDRLQTLARAVAVKLGLPSSSVSHGGQLSTMSEPGTARQRPSYTASFGPLRRPYADHQNARPGIMVTLDAVTGKVWLVYNEWRYVRQPFDPKDLRHSKQDAVAKAFQLLPTGIRRAHGILSTADLTASLEYVFPNGLSPSPKSGSSKQVNRQFPRRTVLAYVVRARDAEVWLSPKTLATLGYVSRG